MENTTHLFRKGQTKKTALRTKLFSGTLISSILFCFIFTSCDNFLDGTALKTQLTQTIEYNNAPYATVEIAIIGAETASIIPAAGTYKDSYKTNDDIELKFEAQSGYCFSHWLAIPEDSVKFADKNAPITTAKINSADKTVTIKPVSLPRPKVVSATPADDSEGVYRDRTIVVKFNKEMNEKSIYWTSDELTEQELQNAINVEGNPELYYACWDGTNPSSWRFKNIEITDYNDSSINLLQYYGEPKFDEGNTRVLRIPTKPDSKTSEAPPGATDILVSLKTGFSYKIEGSNDITLSENFEWSYYTNGGIDNDPPQFLSDTNSGFAVNFADDNETPQDVYKSENKPLKLSKDDFTPASETYNADNFKTLNLRHKKLWVRGSFTDVGSGPKGLKWEIHKVNTAYYPCEAADEYKTVQSGQFNLTITNNSKASVSPKDVAGKDTGGELIELTSLKKEGLYRIDFIASDKNEKTATKSYYFVYDVTPPAASTVIHKSTIAKDAVTVEKKANTAPDYTYSEIQGVTFDDKSFGIKEIKGLGNGSNHHTLTVKDYDYAGNYGTTTVEVTAAASVGMIYYTDGYYSTDYDSTRTPEGVVCKVESDKKFYIWDIWDQYGYCWGNPNLKKTTSGSVNLAHMDVNVSGVDVYDTLVNNLGETEMRKKGMSRTQKWEDGKLSPTIWSYVLDKNKETKPVNAGVKSEKWFIPSRVEIQDIVRNLETLDAAFDKILKDNKYSSRERINNTDYAYRQVKLIEIGGYYWTSMLHWHTDCGAPVTFQKSGALSQDDLYWLGFYDDTSVSGLGSQKYKGDSIILYQSSLDGEKSNELFYMDRCIRRTVYSSALTAEWEAAEAKDMKTHAMALVEME